MKIQQSHYETMKTAISWLPVSLIKQTYSDAMASTKAKDKEKLYRWNLCYAAKLSPFLCDVVYPYADDQHIDTALKKIIKELSIGNFENV